jgi:hypothetical protein
MVFFFREEAEEQAAEDPLETGEGYLPVRIIFTPEAPMQTT